MPRALSTYFGVGHLYSTSITNDPLVAHLFVFPTKALEVFSRPEDPFTEKSVSLRFQAAIVYGFWLGYLTPGPAFNLLW